MLVRMLIWLIVGFLVYTVFQSFKKALQKPGSPPEKSAQGEDMVQDPACGTYVPRSDAISCQIQGRKQFFCSTACRDQYKEKNSKR